MSVGTEMYGPALRAPSKCVGEYKITIPMGWISAIVNAWKADAEIRRLVGLTDAQLAARGLSRQDLPKVLFERHFN